MGCVTCLKCLLIFVNIFFGIIGLILLGGGIFLLVGANKILNENSQAIIAGIGNLAGSSNSGSLSKLDISMITEPAGITLIVIGSFVAIMAFAAAFGACCNLKPILIIYALIIIGLIAAEIILTALFFTGKFNEQIQDTAQSTITKYFVGIDDFGVYSLAWNFIMVERKCCGVNGYMDFDGATKWKRERTLEAGISVNLTTPIACCKLQGSFPNVKILNELCAYQPTDTTSYWKTGCWSAITTYLKDYRTYIILAVSLLMLLQLIIALLAICIACSINNKVSNMSY